MACWRHGDSNVKSVELQLHRNSQRAENLFTLAGIGSQFLSCTAHNVVCIPPELPLQLLRGTPFAHMEDLK